MSFDKGINKFVKELQKTIDDSLSRKQLKRLGDAALVVIYSRTKKGKFVKKTGQIGGARATKALAKSTIRNRQRNKDKLHPTTSPRKSNLTFSGQLLDSLKVKKISARKKSFVISPEGRRKGSSLANFEVAEFVDQNGRPFLGLSNKDLKEIVKLYQSSFAKLVRKRLT